MQTTAVDSPMTDTERFDIFDARLADLEADALGTTVALVSKTTGLILTEFESLEVAFDELATVSDQVRADGFLMFSPEQAPTRPGWQDRWSRAVSRVA